MLSFLLQFEAVHSIQVGLAQGLVSTLKQQSYYCSVTCAHYALHTDVNLQFNNGYGALTIQYPYLSKQWSASGALPSCIKA